MSTKAEDVSEKTFPDSVRFRKTWRLYQERVLSELEEHLEDRHLNIVAAPGSGKTVLGLEVVLRVNRPTLILCPTVALREQWIDRFIEHFLPPELANPDWISRDIRSPGRMTVTTYQALHSAFTGASAETNVAADPEDEESGSDPESEETTRRLSKERSAQVLALLREGGIQTIVLDEAHHLRSEWWKSLAVLKSGLDGARVVSLTATPPFDVAPQEWTRYKDLCGPVDAEVSVPELVLRGDLCPHQDYVHFNAPSKEETRRIQEFRSGVDHLLAKLEGDEAFRRLVASHPYLEAYDQLLEEILEDPAFFSSVLVFLHHTKSAVPTRLVRILGHDRGRLPPWDLSWGEILLTGLLFGRAGELAAEGETLPSIRQDLSRLGAIERRRVQLRSTERIRRGLLSSINKLESVVEIARMENASLAESLRMVVLTDFIRGSDLPSSPEDLKPLNRIGVIPIFESIRRARIPGIRLGVLSGSLVIIPAESQAALARYAAESGVPDSLSFRKLAHDGTYLKAEVSDSGRGQIVSRLTRLFEEGHVSVLVGSKALLGEGWDAPALNTLVLASFVGSYMLSNQMRGRAIRSLARDPRKTANVWHLVCVPERWAGGGDDYDLLRRRFKAFVGVSVREPVIQNGLSRLGLPEPPFDRRRIESVNAEMARQAADREGMRRRWEEALRRGDEGVRLVEELRTLPVRLPRPMVFHNTVRALLWQGLALGGFVTSRALEASSTARALVLAFALGALVALPNSLRAVWLFFKHGPVESSMKQIGEALLRSLSHIGLIGTELSRLGVVAEIQREGHVICNLEGGTSYEKSLFLDALQEVLDPIENPRHVLARESLFGRFLRRDYHAVPEVLGRKRESAEHFARMWRRFVGPAKLHYTRTLQGRRLLLRARGHSLSSAFQSWSERVSSWK